MSRFMTEGLNTIKFIIYERFQERIYFYENARSFCTERGNLQTRNSLHTFKVWFNIYYFDITFRCETIRKRWKKALPTRKPALYLNGLASE